MKFKTVTIVLLITLFCFSCLYAQESEKVKELLSEVDQWVVSDTTKIMNYIDSTKSVTMDMLQNSKYWNDVENELGFLLGIDLVVSPQIDNTGRYYFQMRLTGEVAALFYMDEAMGWPVQLTPNNWADEGYSISGYAVHPSGDFVIVQTNKFGDEMHDLWKFDRDGSFKPLLMDRNKRFYFSGFDQDNPDLFYITLMQTPNMYSTRYSISSGKLDTLYNEPGAFYTVDNYKGKVLLYRSISFSESQLVIYDSNKDELIELTDLAQFSAAEFTEDGMVLAVTSDESRADEFMKFCLYDPSTPKKSEVIFDPKLEVDGFIIPKGQATILALLNKDGYSEFVAFDFDGNLKTVPKPEIGVISGIASNDMGEIVYGYSSPKTPPTAFYFKNGETNLTQLTKVSTFGVDFSDIKVDVIRYKSEDGTLIPSLIYTPEGIQKNGSNPAIVQYHGGPPSQWQPHFQRNFAYALSKGFIIMLPNVRGSTGYGPAWEEADNQEGRFNALKDAEYALDYLINEGYSNPDKIAIWGGSYGGYTVNWLATHASNKIACVVSQVGVSDIDHNLEYTGVGTFIAGYEKEYGKMGSELVRKLSPIYYSEDVNVPILFKTGFYDPRVPPSDSRRFSYVLSKLGKDVWLYEETESGHGGVTKAQTIFDLTSSYVFTMLHTFE